MDVTPDPCDKAAAAASLERLLVQHALFAWPSDVSSRDKAPMTNTWRGLWTFLITDRQRNKGVCLISVHEKKTCWVTFSSSSSSCSKQKVNIASDATETRQLIGTMTSHHASSNLKRRVKIKVLSKVTFCFHSLLASGLNFPFLKFNKVQLCQKYLQGLNLFLKQILWSCQLHWILIDFRHLKSCCDRTLNSENYPPYV